MNSSGFVEPPHSQRYPPLLVFADDWGRHPSSCQHLISRLLDRYSVIWVNTIGTRPPRLDLATLRRGLQKLRSWSALAPTAVATHPNLRVVNPRMWPWIKRPLDRRLNRALLLRSLDRILQEYSEPPIAITTLPITADIMGPLPVAKWVYYCVDDFSVWPGLEQQTLKELERQVIQKADVCIAAGSSLQQHLAEQGRVAEVVRHGVDLAHWRNVAGTPDSVACLAEVSVNFPAPLVIFWGLIDRRLDLETLRAVSNQMDKGTILLVGPVQDPEPLLWSIPKVAHLPAVSYEQLPALARSAAVLIMPYQDIEVVQKMQPLKLLEYLATDAPVVMRSLPSTTAWSDCADVVDSAEQFAAAVQSRLTLGISDDQQRARQQRLSAESWEAKTLQFEALLHGSNCDSRQDGSLQRETTSVAQIGGTR